MSGREATDERRELPLRIVYTRHAGFCFTWGVKRSMAISLVVGSLAFSLCGAEPPAPDAVATSLMHVPIFNFAVHNVAFSPDGKTLATGDGHGIVRLWDVESGSLRAIVQAHTNWAFSVAWSADGTSFVTGGGDDLVQQFETVQPTKPPKTFRGHSNDVHAVAIASDGQSIVSAGDDRRIIVW